ncbi:hypothetical protein TYRP_009812 [Tyrophagus putrescentiae]|nr:hypothetical protein TYRP_009812 [Tyrophagus putrescentiae]
MLSQRLPSLRNRIFSGGGSGGGGLRGRAGHCGVLLRQQRVDAHQRGHCGGVKLATLLLQSTDDQLGTVELGFCLLLLLLTPSKRLGRLKSGQSVLEGGQLLLIFSLCFGLLLLGGDQLCQELFDIGGDRSVQSVDLLLLGGQFNLRQVKIGEGGHLLLEGHCQGVFGAQLKGLLVGDDVQQLQLHRLHGYAG